MMIFFFAEFIQGSLKFQQSFPYVRRSQVIDKQLVHIYYSLFIIQSHPKHSKSQTS